MVNEQFSSSEFRLLAETPLALERAKFYSAMIAIYGNNRRHCWAFVHVRALHDVKQVIWHYEKDELTHGPRAGTDHVTLMSREALALGMTQEELEAAQPTPLVRAALLSFAHLASQLHWIGALAASHFLERRNNPTPVSDGRNSTVRWRDRLVNELAVDPALLSSSNIHAVADEEHSDLIEDVLLRHVVDEEAYRQARQGAWEAQQIDRAYRAAIAHGMRAIESSSK